MENKKCKYIIPWGEACNKNSGKKDYCKNHDATCSWPGCEEHATTGCDSAIGLICGMHICKKHEPTCYNHTPKELGGGRIPMKFN